MSESATQMQTTLLALDRGGRWHAMRTIGQRLVSRCGFFDIDKVMLARGEYESKNGGNATCNGCRQACSLAKGTP